jgi:hypothetical protein
MVIWVLSVGTLAGDNGFDPLRLARNKEQLFLFREAEYKHARLAMLAAIGWPSSGTNTCSLMQSINVRPSQ